MKEAQKIKVKRKTLLELHQTRHLLLIKLQVSRNQQQTMQNHQVVEERKGMTNLKKLGKEDHPILSSIIALLLESNAI